MHICDNVQLVLRLLFLIRRLKSLSIANDATVPMHLLSATSFDLPRHFFCPSRCRCACFDVRVVPRLYARELGSVLLVAVRLGRMKSTSFGCGRVCDRVSSVGSWSEILKIQRLAVAICLRWYHARTTLSMEPMMLSSWRVAEASHSIVAVFRRVSWYR